MSDRDYYEILGLTPKADGTMVDQSYWHLARKYQALAVTNARARFMLDDLNEAYGVLGHADATSAVRRVSRRRADPQGHAAAGERQVAASASGRRTELRLAREARSVKLPGIQMEHWRTYATGGVIMALALAAAWQGVNLLFVSLAIIGGLALTLTPVLKRRVADMNIALPSVGMPAMPELKAPQITMPKLAELNVPALRDIAPIAAKDDAVAPDELHASTSALISRWRTSVGLRPLAPAELSEDGEPSLELVDIVESERTLEEHDDGEPLAAVIDILRGSRKPVETPRRGSPSRRAGRRPQSAVTSSLNP